MTIVINVLLIKWNLFFYNRKTWVMLIVKKVRPNTHNEHKHTHAYDAWAFSVPIVWSFYKFGRFTLRNNCLNAI